MTSITDSLRTLRLLSQGLSASYLVAIFVASIPIFIEGIQLLLYSITYAFLHLPPFGSIRGGDADHQTSAGDVGSTGNGCPYLNRAERFPFIPPAEGDDRSPCPALNALANHGFIPRTGRGLTPRILIKGLQEGYGISTPLAAFLAYGGVLLLGQVVGFGSDPSRDGVGFSLHDLARHNRTEHDASITHPNMPAGDEYAPITQDPALFDAFVRDARPAPGPAQKGVLSFGVRDIARVRVRREAEPSTRIDAVREEIGRGEAALVLGIFGFLPTEANASADEHKLPMEVLGGNYRLPLSVVETWWKEERFPTPDWEPARTTTLLGTFALQGMIRKEMQVLRDNSKIKKE